MTRIMRIIENLFFIELQRKENPHHPRAISYNVQCIRLNSPHLILFLDLRLIYRFFILLQLIIVNYQLSIVNYQR